ncbi:PH domain-containing protein [Rothia sp. P4278]|uniref:PH domain-containing protein n=1 Tax=Rothia sp. P4278 TaxID=3402658 RepID=UPI003ADF3999
MKLRGPLNPDEYTLTATRAHGIVLVRPLCYVLVAMALWSFSSALGSAQAWISYPALMVSLVLAVLAVRHLAAWILTSYLLTSDRLVIRRGLSAKKDICVPLYEIERVSVGYKALMGVVAAAPLTVYGRGISHVLRAVPDPERFSARIRTAQEEYLER